MANFAQLNEKNEVIRIISISDEDCQNKNGIEVEEIGIDFCKRLVGEDTIWKQVSINARIRGRYPIVGCVYDEILDAFISPRPEFDSWVFDKNTLNWESPIGPAPELTEKEILDGAFYTWNENNHTWNIFNPSAINN